LSLAPVRICQLSSKYRVTAATAPTSGLRANLSILVLYSTSVALESRVVIRPLKIPPTAPSVATAAAATVSVAHCHSNSKTGQPSMVLPSRVVIYGTEAISRTKAKSCSQRGLAVVLLAGHPPIDGPVLVRADSLVHSVGTYHRASRVCHVCPVQPLSSWTYIA
jgi:hypothetical protein